MQENMRIFCSNIHQRRTEMGISVVELAERSGLPQAMLEALEQGSIPDEMVICDAIYLAKVFGCKCWELFIE